MSVPLLLLAASAVLGQHAGDWVPEVRPRLLSWQCSIVDGCRLQNTSVVLDSSYRYFHVTEDADKCLDNHLALVPDYCYDAENCAFNCRLEGANYTDSGVTTVDDGAGLRLDLNVNGTEKHPRVFLFDETTQNYMTINLVGHEITFDVDMSQTACDLGATLYVVHMPFDGGRSEYNTVGAAYGTGYCDYFCPARAFINGEANIDTNGVCCAEVDIWEASAGMTHIGALSIREPGPQICKPGATCAPHQLGGCGYTTPDNSFYGWGSPLDVRQPMTVVTKFHSSYSNNYVAGSSLAPGSYGDRLLSVQRIYIQNNTVISTDGGQALIPDSLICDGMVSGLANMGNVIRDGMVLTFSMFSRLNFLGNGGGKQCWHYTLANATVLFSNVRWGDMGTTYNVDGSDFVLPR